MAHELIDSGADIIIGHHPHVVQGMEIYRGKPIFYSLGNFIFDQYFSKDTMEGLAIDINLTDDGWQIKLLPFKSERSQARMTNGEEKENFLKKFRNWSPAVPDEVKEQIRNGQIRWE